MSDYEMKLMDLDVEQLGIPVSNSSSSFTAFWVWFLLTALLLTCAVLRPSRSRSTAAW